MYLFRNIAVALISIGFLAISNAHSLERNPLSYITRVENAVLKTPSHRVHALSTFDLTFDLHGEQRIRLRLSPNHDVIADGATIQHMAPDGTLHSSEPMDRMAYKVFKGQTLLQYHAGAEWTNVGWARIILHHDGQYPLFEGAFRVDGDHHHIQTKTHFMQTRHVLDPELEETDSEYMVVWRDSDIGTDLTQDGEGLLHGELKRSLGQAPLCSAEVLNFNSNPEHPVYRAMLKRDDKSWGSASTRSLFGRQIDGQTGGNSAGVNLASTIGQTAGCPGTRKVALVGIATDCTYTAGFANKSVVTENIISILNSASVQYEDSFNITLGLHNLTISDAACPATAPASAPWNVDCSNAAVDIQTRLNLFSAWRAERPDANAYWTLLSTCATQSAVGLAWLGQACVTSSQTASSGGTNETVSGANVVVRTGTEWQVLAHETGHTFGAVHDCSESTCNDGDAVASQQCCPLSATVCDAGAAYIMNPSTGPNIQRFSPCSIGNICSAIGRNSVKTGCLTANKDITTITGQQCGNGIVEAGEDCDCGGESGCTGNTCCDPTTCKFTTNSVCDPSNEDCCTSTCQFSGNGTVCRASTGTCDPQETCSGASSTCPVDLTAPDGQSCGGSLSCAAGQCTSRDLQCKTIMGSYTQGNDTYACSSSGCRISCASPEFGSNVCYSMQQNFLDGTSCQGGGRCNNGQCNGASVGREISSWITNHKTLVIVLCCVIGGLLVLSILCCCWSRYRKRSRTRQRIAAGPPPPPPGWTGASNWQAPPRMAGARGQPNMVGPPAGGNGYWENGRWKTTGPAPIYVPGPSVRYA